MLRFWRLLAGGLVLVVTACGGDSGAATTVATTQPSTTTPTTQLPTTTVAADSPPSEPGAVIEYLYEVWLDDRAAAAAVFAEDAVISNIVTPGSPNTREGIRSIGVWLAQEASLNESLEITEIEVDGDTVIWDDLACTGSDCWTATGNVAVITDGKIVSWDFGEVSPA